MLEDNVAAAAAIITPAKLISILTLVSALLTGGLINNVPSSDVLNITSLFTNCTFFSAKHQNDNSNSSGGGGGGGVGPTSWQLVLPILFPIIFIFIKNQDKLQSLVQHITGQIAAFSSTEVVRHFIVSPNGNFTARCNLTEQECQTLPELDSVNTSTLCPHTAFSDQQLFDSLHSIPSLTGALFGSATVFLLCNLESAKKMMSPLFKVHPACQKYAFCSRQLLKFACVGTFLAEVYYFLWQSLKMNKNSLQELVFSFGYSAAVQLAVFKTAKNVPPQPVVPVLIQ